MITVNPREIVDKGYAKVLGVNKMYYGLCENGKFEKSYLLHLANKLNCSKILLV